MRTANDETSEKSKSVSNAKKVLSELGDATQKIAAQATETVKQSGNDWFVYVKNHPFQTMAYGLVFYFAIKGMIRPNSSNSPRS